MSAVFCYDSGHMQKYTMSCVPEDGKANNSFLQSINCFLNKAFSWSCTVERSQLFSPQVPVNFLFLLCVFTLLLPSPTFKGHRIHFKCLCSLRLALAFVYCWIARWIMFASSSSTHFNVVYSNVDNADFLVISSICTRCDNGHTWLDL